LITKVFNQSCVNEIFLQHCLKEAIGVLPLLHHFVAKNNTLTYFTRYFKQILRHIPSTPQKLQQICWPETLENCSTHSLT